MEAALLSAISTVSHWSQRIQKKLVCVTKVLYMPMPLTNLYPKAPPWCIIEMGLNLSGVCRNQDCDTFKEFDTSGLLRLRAILLTKSDIGLCGSLNDSAYSP